MFIPQEFIKYSILFGNNIIRKSKIGSFFLFSS